MVGPPAAAIRDLLVLGGLGEILRPEMGPELAVLAVTRRQRGVFGIALAHRNRVCVAQLSDVDDVESCLTLFLAIRDLLVFSGFPRPRRVRSWVGSNPGLTLCFIGGSPAQGLGFKPGLNHVFFWGGGG